MVRDIISGVQAETESGSMVSSLRDTIGQDQSLLYSNYVFISLVLTSPVIEKGYFDKRGIRAEGEDELFIFFLMNRLFRAEIN